MEAIRHLIGRRARTRQQDLGSFRVGSCDFVDRFSSSIQE
jgi:hypothetical protein